MYNICPMFCRATRPLYGQHSYKRLPMTDATGRFRSGHGLRGKGVSATVIVRPGGAEPVPGGRLKSWGTGDRPLTYSFQVKAYNVAGRRGDTFHDRLDATTTSCRVQFPGVAKTWTRPVRGGSSRLLRGMRGPLGLKNAGPNLQRIQELGTSGGTAADVEVPSRVFAETYNDGRYIDIQWDTRRTGARGQFEERGADSGTKRDGGATVTHRHSGARALPGECAAPAGRARTLELCARCWWGGARTAATGALGQTGHGADCGGGWPGQRDDSTTKTPMLTGIGLELDGRDPEDYVGEATGVLARKTETAVGERCCGAPLKRAAHSAGVSSSCALTHGIHSVLLECETLALAKTCLVMRLVTFSARCDRSRTLGIPMSYCCLGGMIALLGVVPKTGTSWCYSGPGWHSEWGGLEWRPMRDLTARPC